MEKPKNNIVRKMVDEEEGLSAVEYGVLAILIIVAVAAFGTQISTSLSDAGAGVSNEVSQAIQQN